MSHKLVSTSLETSLRLCWESCFSELLETSFAFSKEGVSRALQGKERFLTPDIVITLMPLELPQALISFVLSLARCLTGAEAEAGKVRDLPKVAQQCFGGQAGVFQDFI